MEYLFSVKSVTWNSGTGDFIRSKSTILSYYYNMSSGMVGKNMVVLFIHHHGSSNYNAREIFSTHYYAYLVHLAAII